MCLYIKNTHKKNTKGIYIPNIATKDVICYKWLDKTEKGFKTPFRNVLVKIPSVMKAKLGISRWFGHQRINKGIHAYVKKKEISTDLRGEDDAILVKCIIPKGSKYFEGTNNDIVANNMKLIKIIKKV